MQTSIFLAKLIGPLFLAIGLGIAVNHDVFQAMGEEFLRSTALIFLSGLLTLVAGLAIVNLHNVWTRDWRVVVTIVGWLAALGGVLRIVAPQAVQSIGAAMFMHRAAMIGAAVVVLAVGVTLSFKGYRP